MSPDHAEPRVYRAGDEQEILDGLNHVHGLRLSLEEWNWAYPPHESGRSAAVAVVDGAIVAHVGGVCSRVRIGGSTVPAMALVDEFSLPVDQEASLRGRRMKRLVEILTEADDRDESSGLVFRMTSGGRDAEASAFGGQAVALPVIDVMIRSGPVRAPLRRVAYRAEPARDWEPRLDDLWRRVRHDYPLALVRDAEMALHRHAGHPARRRHRFLVCPRFSASAVAWVVFETDSEQCRWVDLVWDHNEPGALDLVCHLSGHLARQVGAGEERMILGGDPETVRHLHKAGFARQDRREDAGLEIISLPTGSDAAVFDGRFYVTSTDLDPLRRVG